MFAARNGLMLQNNPPKCTVGSGFLTVNGSSAGSNSATSCVTSSLKCNDPCYLLCFVGTYSLSSTAPSCFFAGSYVMTNLSAGLEGTYLRCTLYGLQLPSAAQGVSGVFQADTPSGYVTMIGMAIPGVFKATGVVNGNAGNSAAPSLTVASGVGQLAVGGVAAWNTLTANSGTPINAVNNTDDNMIALQKAGATSVVLSATQTSTYWAMAGVSLKRIAA